MASNTLWQNKAGSNLKSGTVTISNDNQPRTGKSTGIVKPLDKVTNKKL